MIKKRSTWHSPPATLLDKANDVELRGTHISEPEKLYAEYLCYYFNINKNGVLLFVFI